jgi:hypothetical protein
MYINKEKIGVPAIPDQPGLEKSNGQISSQPFITNYGYI